MALAITCVMTSLTIYYSYSELAKFVCYAKLTKYRIVKPPQSTGRTLRILQYCYLLAIACMAE